MAHIIEKVDFLSLVLFIVGAGFYNTTDRGQFGDSLAEMDDSVGKIMEFIEEAGIMENTVIFFSADNG